MRSTIQAVAASWVPTVKSVAAGEVWVINGRYSSRFARPSVSLHARVATLIRRGWAGVEPGGDGDVVRMTHDGTAAGLLGSTRIRALSPSAQTAIRLANRDVLRSMDGQDQSGRQLVGRHVMRALQRWELVRWNGWRVDLTEHGETALQAIAFADLAAGLRYDPDPPVRVGDTDGYDRYARSLDLDHPGWHRDRTDRMVEWLAERALARR